MRRTRGERGAGTVLAVAMAGLLVSVTLAAAGVVALVAAHRMAQSAADLAALAGASALQDGGDACTQAGAVADRNHAELRACTVDGWDVAVEVVTHAPLPGVRLELTARGRAGPADRAEVAAAPRISRPFATPGDGNPPPR